MEKLPNYSLKNSHNSPHNEKLTGCQAQTDQNRTLGLSTPSLRFQNIKWIGLAHHRVRYLVFGPSTFSKDGTRQDTGLFYYLYFILGVAKGGAASLISWAEILIYPAYMSGLAVAPQRNKCPSIL